MHAAPPPAAADGWTQLGARLAAYRKARGYTQESFAPLTHYGRSTIAGVETGRQRVRRSFWTACDELLSTGGTLTAEFERLTNLIASDSEQVSREHSGYHGKPFVVQAPVDSAASSRRQPIAESFSGVTAVQGLPLTSLEMLRNGLNRAVDYDSWRDVVAEYGHAYYTTPLPIVIERLAADLTILNRLLETENGRHRLRMIQVLSRLSVLMAMALAATGHKHLARRWWQSARIAASKSQDPDTEVFVGAWEVVTSSYGGRPLAYIIARADQLLSLAADRVNPAIAGLNAGRAQALALIGRRDEAVAAVQQVANLTDRMPAYDVDNVGSMFGWPEHRFRYTESFVYSHVGQQRDALRAQDRALRLYPEQQARLRTQVQLHRALCLIRSGDTPNGLRYAATVLDQLPAHRHTTVLREVARQVLNAVPDDQHFITAYADVEEKLRSHVD